MALKFDSVFVENLMRKIDDTTDFPDKHVLSAFDTYLRVTDQPQFVQALFDTIREVRPHLAYRARVLIDRFSPEEELIDDDGVQLLKD